MTSCFARLYSSVASRLYGLEWIFVLFVAPRKASKFEVCAFGRSLSKPVQMTILVFHVDDTCVNVTWFSCMLIFPSADTVVFKAYTVQMTDAGVDLNDFYYELAVLVLTRGLPGFVQLVAVGVSKPSAESPSQQQLILVLQDMGRTLLELVVKGGPLHVSNRPRFKLVELLFYILPAMVDVLRIQQRLRDGLRVEGVTATIWDVKLDNFCGTVETFGALQWLKAWAIDAEGVM